MTPDTIGPLSRPLSVERLPAEGSDVIVTATPEECTALAEDFGLAAIRALEGRYQLSGTARRVRVVGRIRADITQVCVVTLEPFDSVLDEQVELNFETPSTDRELPSEEILSNLDAPDEIVNGQIDLGAVTAEFLALGLDPYPRKPGVAFTPPEEAEATSPFAGLAKLKGAE